MCTESSSHVPPDLQLNRSKVVKGPDVSDYFQYLRGNYATVEVVIGPPIAVELEFEETD
jgi:hypothetical protein